MLKDHINIGSVSALLTVLAGLGAIAFPRLAAHKGELDSLVPQMAIVALGAVGLVDEIVASVKARRAKKQHHANHHPDPR